MCLCHIEGKRCPKLHKPKCCYQGEEGDPSLLLNTNEDTHGVLGPVLGLPVQERHGATRESPGKGHKVDEGTGTSAL